jgi:peptidoglycan hydrolase-like protein with peptidoglycan-binding domain
MEGDGVRQLQQRLKTKGFYNGAIDGIFGSQTEASVRQAQAANNLTVDGIVGPATWRALN